MANNIIKGRKGGSSSQRTSTEQPDDLQSVAKAKILIALGEGEFAGGLTGKDIYLDGTPLENADGSQNFSGVAWEFRPGTQAQSYIQGIPGTENEISVGTEVSSETAWTHTFTNTQLSAVRVRLKWPSLMKQEDDGDVVGNTVKYAIDLQTDGGAWQTVLETAVSGKTTSGYERSHRIDLPQAGSTWTLRLRKVSPDANSVKIGDVMTLQSYTEVIDAKLRYPHTALLYIEFDSSQFNGSIPQISCEPRGRIVRVPDNYNPETREYTGTWTGGFKWAWTDNPAWIYYDIVVSDRFGLGDRLTSANISKWALYPIAQYCDQLIPDGRGGDGMEPRYLCNVYVQERNDAYTVLRDFAAIFRGMTCWSGEQIIVQADMPRDVDFNYTRANIIGSPRYSSSTSKARYTNALVSWSDPANAYADAMEPAFVPELVSRYSFNQLEVTAIGCTRQSEAHRKGLWGILTNNKDRMVEIDVGLDGKIPQPGYIIGLADELLAGRVNGGRISAVNGRVITLDRDTDAKAGDRLQLNLPSGISQARTIQSVNGRRQVTVTTAYSETPEVECVWVIESDDLYVQQYRVIGVKDNNNATYTITGVAHDPDKFPRIDTGAIIDQRPVSVIPPGSQQPPESIVISSYSVVNQGISVETMQVHWNAVKDAISYEAQWRRNDGNWINVPRSSATSFEVSGIYAGRYLARVRAINAAEVSSGWAYSEEKTLTGKIGLPSAPLALTTTSLLHGVQLNWEFPEGSGDTQKTELQYSPNPNGNGAMALSDVAYPGKTYQQMGLQIAAIFWYRARIVDRIGNESPWTAWVQGMASDDIGEYYDKLTEAIKDTEAWQEAQRDIEETHKELIKTAEAIREEVAQQVTDINQSIDDSASEIRQQVDGQIESVNKSITENINSVNQTLSDNITAVNKSITDAVSDINASVDQQIADVNKTLTEGDAALKSRLQAVENSLKQSIAQANTGWDKAVKQETADRIADVNAKAAQAADQLLNEKNERVAAIESTQQIIQNVNDSLATQMAQISAGTGEQFDSQAIWYFDNDREGWTSNGGTPSVVENGWLRPANHATDAYITSPGISISGSAYRFLKLRLKKTGTPAWSGQIRWRYEGQSFNDSRMLTVAEPDYDSSGRAVLSIQDIPWGSDDSKPVVQFRLDLTVDQSDDNFIIIDWIAVGRPTPGASTAALREESTARANADTAEANKRATLATQMRGTSESNNLADLRSGLLFQEMNARITADKAEVTARESLQTQFNDNRASVADELSSISTAQSAQASKISGLETSLGKKADASAVQSLTQKVEQQGATLTSQGNTLTSLSNRVGKTESGVAANSSAITGLQSTVSQQGDKLTSQGQSLTKLTNDLSTTNANVNKKADATALQSLQNTVTLQGSTLSTQGNAITSLENSLNALDVGGTNQIPDSGSLTRYGNVSAEKYNGNGVMAFTLKAGVAYRDLISIDLSAPVDGTEYVLSFYAKAVVNGQKVRSHFYSPNSTKKSVSSQGNTFTNSDGLCDFTLTTEWQRYWVKWTQSAGSGSKKLIVARINPGSTDQTVYLSSPKFERGNVPTAWSEAPEDNASAAAVNALTSRVDSAEGTLTSQGQAITKLNNDVATTNGNVNKKADATALNALTTRVSSAEGKLESQGQSITSLQNGLTTANQNIGKKADSSAVNTLTNRVSQVENTLTTQSESITSLSGSISTLRNQVSNPWFDGSLESYADGQQISGSGAVVTTAQKFNGSRSLRLHREANNGGNSDKQIGPWSSIRENAVYSIELWAMMPADQSPSSGWQTIVGIQGQNAAGQNSWQGAVTITESGLGERGKWVKFSGKARMNGAGRTRGVVWISTRGATGSGTPGYDLYIDDVVITDITDAQAAQTTADATASAVDSLTTKVSQQDNTISSIGSRTTALENGLSTTNADVSKKADASTVQTLQNTVTQQGKDLTAANSAITRLTSDLSTTNANVSKKADSTALQTLQNTVTQQGKDLSSQGASLTQLTSRLSESNASADADGKIPGNLITNASFERGTDGFSGWSDRASVVTLQAPYNGTRAARLTAGGAVGIGQDVDFVKGRTYQIGVRAKQDSGTTIADGNNTKFRIADGTGLIASSVYGPFTSDWQEVKFTWKAPKDVRAAVQFTAYLGAGAMYFDDFYVVDITDRVDIDAAANAIGSLTTRVTSAEGSITSQGSSITKLTNDLATTNGNVNKKADAAALQTLQNTVTQQGKEVASQGTALTSLENSLNTLSVGGANLIRHSDTLEGWSSRHPSETWQGASVAWTRLAKGAGGYVQLDELTLDVTGKTEFIYSFYAKGAYAAQEMTAYFYNPSNTSRVETSQGYKSSAGDGAAPFTLTTSWQRYWVRWVIPATTGTKRLIPARLQQAPSADKEVWLCRPKLETGNVVTDWTPNNDDIAADIKASAGAIQDLTTRVTTAEGKITSSATAITRLQNDLALTQGDVSKKAEQSALNSLTGRVEKTESGLSAANSSITSLNAAVRAGNASSGDLIPNPTFDPAFGQMGLVVVSTTSDGVPSGCPFANAVKLTGRDHHPDMAAIPATEGDVFEMSALASCGVGAADFNFYLGTTTSSNANTNQPLFTGGNTKATAQWKRVTWRFTVSQTMVSRGYIRPFLQISQSSPFGTIWYVTDWHLRNITAAASAQDAADATAKAVDSLTTTVNQQGSTLTSIGNRTTTLENGLSTTNANVNKKADASTVQTLQNTVTQQGKDLTAANSAITKLTGDLSTTNANVNKKADATALQSLQNTVTQQGSTLSTQGNAITSLENSLNALDVGGTNQIPDSGSLARYGNVSAEKYNGNGVMAFTLKAGAAYRDLISIDLSAPVDGTEYVLSFYAKAAANGQKVRSHFYSPNSTKKSVSSQGNTFTNSDGLCDFTLTTEWQRYWVKWTQSAGSGSKKLIVAHIQPGSTDQTVYLSSPKFERGNVPTAWSEAPEDNASAAAVNALTSRVDSAEGTLTSQGQAITKLNSDLATTNASVNKKADATALTALTNRVTSAEGKLESQGQSITSLQNGLTTANQNIGKKADSSAVNTLTNRVSQVENTLTTQSESITSLSGSISTLRNQVSNPWFDGSLESYADGQQLYGSAAVVTTAQKFNGSRSLRLRREANNGGNSDKQIGPWSSIRENAVYSIELWAMMPADQSPSSGWQTIVGIQGQNAAGQNSWQGAVTITESGLGERGKWVKFSGKARMNGAGRTRGVVWISTRGATGSGTPGYDLYIDDVVITDITDAQDALNVADASTTAVNSLTTRVTDAENKITAQSQQLTSLQSSLNGKADAGALNSLTSRVTSAEGKITSTANSLTSLNSTVGTLSSTVQAQGNTLVDTNNKISSMYSIKVETNNGKKVGAGIVLGSDGSTSDMILYADRFSLFNRNNKTAVPVMIAEGNELYIDTARIKNGTIDTAKIKDATITSAKIAGALNSVNYDWATGNTGWCLNMNGDMVLNNALVRGHIEATSGTFKGRLEAQEFIGDIAVARRYGDLSFRRNNTVQRDGRYQNRGYGMTIVLSCTLIYQVTGGNEDRNGYVVEMTFNVGGQEVTRRFPINPRMTSGFYSMEFRFAADISGNWDSVPLFVRARGRDASWDYQCYVENITATAFRTNSNSFS
ncbi:DUF1983 domain-containing protein [Klebsiella pneumoniae]|uniref:TipJ family phage tail tip protein n=1 Tax=Klebsiella pneumoniae TaxID=573 RepID=UPI0034E083A7